jgi:hypothetical protein
MILEAKRSGALVLRLMVGLALLGWPKMGAAQGTWSVISYPPEPPLAQKTGEVAFPGAVAVDAAGSLYVAQGWYTNGWNGRIQKRDAQGNCCYENRLPGPVQARGTPATPQLREATGR